MKEEGFLAEGVITEAMRGAMFRVELDSGHTVLARISGRLRKYRIRLLEGDRVRVEVSPYDVEKGRIVYRL